jgi:hypothetical protein
MTVLIGILGALIVGAVSGTATYILSKRENDAINQEISKMHGEWHRAS